MISIQDLSSDVINFITDSKSDFPAIIIGCFGVAIGVVALIISSISIYKTSKYSSASLFVDLLKEYRSKEMKKDLDLLYKNYLKYSKKNSKNDMLKKYNEDEKWQQARRNVSHFFQEIEILRNKGFIKDELIFDYWSYKVIKEKLEIIKPLEKVELDNRGIEVNDSTKLFIFDNLLKSAKTYE
ncbi:MAG: hypothetical protein KAS51_00005, partial [Candidatus Omnitrophica bacterium]|nr:hypothetical protein [Candidatus Omnitrophota bacterium]